MKRGTKVKVAGFGVVLVAIVGYGVWYWLVTVPRVHEGIMGVANTSLAVAHLPESPPLARKNGDGFRLARSYPPEWEETGYLRRAFPELNLADTGFKGEVVEVDANQALAAILELSRTGHFPATPSHLLDPWGTPYAVFGRYDGGDFRPPSFTWQGSSVSPRPTLGFNQVFSAGPDRVFGTADDIWSGERVVSD